MMIKGLASRTPVTAGHKQEILVYFVWSLCLLEFLFHDHEKEKGSGWGLVSHKSTYKSKASSHSAQSVFGVTLCHCPGMDLGMAEEPKAWIQVPAQRKECLESCFQPGSSWDGWDTEIKCLEPKVTCSVSSASGPVKPRFHPVPWLLLLKQ